MKNPIVPTLLAVALGIGLYLYGNSLLEMFQASVFVWSVTSVSALAIGYLLCFFSGSTKDLIVSIIGVVIIGFCFYGFGSKFIELVRLVATDSVAAQEGVFAVAPLMNYLLASAGFLCLLGWAAFHGMFRNIEQPKETMLEVNAKLDAEMNDLKFCSSVMGKEATLQ